jgi:hypothetical protein
MTAMLRTVIIDSDPASFVPGYLLTVGCSCGSCSCGG